MIEHKNVDPFISIQRNGRLKFQPGVVNNVIKKISTCINCSSIHEVYSKMRYFSAMRIKTSLRQIPEIFSVSRFIVKYCTRSVSLVSVPGLYSDLDLDAGKYEGGFKVWESTVDLVRFISEDQTLMTKILRRRGEFRALELGAGSSLASLSLLGRMIDEPSFDADYRIDIQDYNWQVLAFFSLSNFTINLPSDFVEALISTKSLRFFYGDWKNFKTSSKYDLIMMSEVLYNSDSYESLHNLLASHISHDGYIVIATKETYFGLTGGLFQWCDYVSSQKILSSEKIIKVQTTNVPRSLLIMKRLKT